MNEAYAMLAVVVGVSLVAMSIFLFVRRRLEERRAFWLKRLYSNEEIGTPNLLASELVAGPPKNWSDQVDRNFEQLAKQSGIAWTTDQAIGMVALSGVVVAGALYLWLGDIWHVAMGLLLGVSLPLGVLVVLRARWRAGLQRQLPDVIFLLARSLRAGESLEQAMETVATHGTRPLADEFRHAVEKIKLGLAVPVALRGMARRLELPDFNIFVAAVTLHRTVGGNLTQLLDRVATSVRDRNLFRGYVLAATALSRITGFFIAAAAPLLFLGYLVWRPDFVLVFMQSNLGLRALWLALGLEIVGAAWMYYLLRVTY